MLAYFQDFLDGSSRLWMGLGVKDEGDGAMSNNETPAAAGEVAKEAVKNDYDSSGDMGESVHYEEPYIDDV